jgi:hypothetical protein
MVGILLRLGSGVKNVAANYIGGDELRQIAQQRLIARGDHSVAARGLSTFITPSYEPAFVGAA